MNVDLLKSSKHKKAFYSAEILQVYNVDCYSHVGEPTIGARQIEEEL